MPVHFLNESHDSPYVRRLGTVVTVVLVETGAGVVIDASGEYHVRSGNVVVYTPSHVIECTPIRPLRVGVVTIDEMLLLDAAGWIHGRSSAAGRARVHALLMTLRRPVVVLHPEPNEFRRMHRLLVSGASEVLQSESATAGRLAVLAKLMTYLDPLMVAEHPDPSFTAQLRAAADITMPEVAHPGVRSALEFLAVRPPSEWSVAAMAEHARLSPGHFARVFAAHVGESPQKFLAQQRLLEFTRRVESTQLTIDQAARSVGWTSTSHAISEFRRRFAETPAEHRAALDGEGGASE